jgi:hypothetical protein
MSYTDDILENIIFSCKPQKTSKNTWFRFDWFGFYKYMLYRYLKIVVNSNNLYGFFNNPLVKVNHYAKNYLIHIINFLLIKN